MRNNIFKNGRYTRLLIWILQIKPKKFYRTDIEPYIGTADWSMVLKHRLRELNIITYEDVKGGKNPISANVDRLLFELYREFLKYFHENLIRAIKRIIKQINSGSKLNKIRKTQLLISALEIKSVKEKHLSDELIKELDDTKSELEKTQIIEKLSTIALEQMERIIAGSKKYQMAIGDVKTRYSSIEEWIKERDMDIQRIPLSRGIAFFEERLYKIISLFNMNKCSIYDIFKKIIYIMGIDYADPNIRDELLNESKKTQKNTLIQYLEDDLNKRMNKINDDVVALYEIAFLYQRLIKANIK